MNEPDKIWSAWDECVKHKWLYIIVSGLATVGSLLFSLSIPTAYSAQTKIIVEKVDKNPLDHLWRKMPLSKTETKSIVTTEERIYYDLLSTPQFANYIANIHVTDKEGTFKTTYADYLRRHTKQPFWGNIFGKPHLHDIVGENIQCEVNRKTDIITLQAKAQDPLVAALLVDSTKAYIQSFMSVYKSEKARQRYNSLLAMRKEAGKQYHQAQNKYAAFVDTHTDNELIETKAEALQLKNEVSLAYQNYTSLVRECKKEEMKIQQEKPAFASIEQTRLPTVPSNPRFMVNLSVWLCCSWVLATWLILYRRQFRERRAKA